MNTKMGKECGRRIQRGVGAVLTSLVAVMLLGSSASKFAHVPSVVGQLAAIGIAGNKLVFVAVLEAVSALLFLIPSTRLVGLLLVSAFLGGAVATHLQHGLSIVAPSSVLMLIWLGTWLRHPEIMLSWLHRCSAVRGAGEVQ
jgi:DoxX-like protein